MPAGVCDTESVYWCSGEFFLLFYVRGRVHERFFCPFLSAQLVVETVEESVRESASSVF